jgi:hypothetical protein
MTLPTLARGGRQGMLSGAKLYFSYVTGNANFDNLKQLGALKHALFKRGEQVL